MNGHPVFVVRLAKLCHVDAELVLLSVREQIFPRSLVSLFGGHAAQHRAACALYAGCDLIVEFAGDDAFDEATVFLWIGLR